MIHRLFLIFSLLFSVGAFAQQPGGAPAPVMDHAAHLARSAATVAQPREPGQSAFAAIHEIVLLLEVDPATDWSKVNIEGLRRHLIDMNNVTLGAEVAGEPIDGGARYTITGAGAVRDSIRRMVKGHAEAMNGVGGWGFIVKEHPAGIILSVTVNKVGDIAKLRALGFIGAMTRGMHHQSHHLMISAGHGPHE